VFTPFVKTGVTKAESSHNCKAEVTLLQILQRHRMLLISNILKTKMGKYSIKYNNTTSHDVHQTRFIITETVLTLHSLPLHSTTDRFVVNPGNFMITWLQSLYWDHGNGEGSGTL